MAPSRETHAEADEPLPTFPPRPTKSLGRHSRASVVDPHPSGARCKPLPCHRSIAKARTSCATCEMGQNYSAAEPQVGSRPPPALAEVVSIRNLLQDNNTCRSNDR